MNITLDKKLIKRTSKKHIQTILSKNNNWKILDIGCGYSANEFANTICDVQDLSKFYEGKNFVKLEKKQLPFKDNQFDFVIASHVLEHVEDPLIVLSIMIDSVRINGYLVIANCFYPVIKCHLPHFT